MGKRFSMRSIKKDRHYTYRDLVDELKVTPQTIRSWGNSGLTIYRDGRPHFIIGEDLIAFHTARNDNRPKLPEDRFRCFQCKGRKHPAWAARGQRARSQSISMSSRRFSIPKGEKAVTLSSLGP